MLMEKYEEKAPTVRWEQLLEFFEGMSDPVWWIDRFRVQFYLDANMLIGLQGVFRYTALCLSAFLYHLGRIVWTFPRKRREWSVSSQGVLYLLDDNPTYLSTMLPVINRAIVEGDTVTVVARRRHRDLIRARLSSIGKEGGFEILTYEDLALGYPSWKRFTLLTAALAGCVGDLYVWLGSTIPKKWVVIPRFISFALVNRFYGPAARDAWKGVPSLVAANDHFIWEALMFASTGPDVRSHILQHGVLARFASPTLAHRYLVWGESHREILVGEMGSSPGSVVVTGAPRFDGLIREAGEWGHRDRDTVCFLSQSHGAALMGNDGYRRAVELFCRLAELFGADGLKFLLKLHPRDNENSVRDFKDLYGKWITITREDLLPVLDRSLVTLTVDSTAVFESVIMGVPVIQLKPRGIMRFTDFSTDGLTILCRDLVDLGNVFETTILDGKAYAWTVEEMKRSASRYLANPGSAAEAVLRSIRE